MVYLLLGLLALQAALQHLERRDLYARLHATAPERRKEKKKMQRVESAHERVLKRWRQQEVDKQ